jgi:hypothetical protein
MSAETSPSGEAELPTATIHEAELASGPSGAVAWGPELDFEQAVARRRQGQDVVVRGGNGKANQQLAGRVEAAVGPRTRAQPPERKAGPLALPHFHQESRDPEGHSFYETDKRKARKQK